MADINVIVGDQPSRNITLGNPQKNINIGTPGVIFQPLDYRQGIVDLTSGILDINFSFSTPFTADPVFGGDIIYNGTVANDGYAYHVYNLSRSGCDVCFSDNLHSTGYQFHYYATAN